MSHITPQSPAAAILSTLATAYRHNRVSYAAVPEECRPPRFVVEFGTAAEVRAFETAVHHLADAGEDFAGILGRVVDLAGDYLSPTGGPVLAQPEVLRHLIATMASALMVTVEDHGPLKVLEISPHFLPNLQVIAALALAGAVAWDRATAPGEAGETIQSAPPTMDDVVGEQIAACTDGLRPAVIYGPEISCDTCLHPAVCLRQASGPQNGCWEARHV